MTAFPPGPLADLLDTAARRWPDRPALTAAGTTATFAELAAASGTAAGRLAAAGAGPGDRIVVTGVPGVRTAVLIWAAARAGAVVTVVHDQVRAAALRHVLTDCRPALLVSDDPVARDGAGSEGVRAVPSAAVAGTGPDPGPASDPATGRPLGTDPVLMIYTSGSTAAPKAVVSTHAQVVFAAAAIQDRLGYRSDDVVHCPLPLSFDYGLYQLFLGALAGAHVHLGRPADAGPALLRALAGSGATVLAAVPAVAEALARLVTRAPDRAPVLRLLTNTGAAMPPAVLARLRAAIPTLRVQLMFGLTECKRTTIMPIDGDLDRPGSCGLPLPGTRVLIVDDGGTEVPPGEVGQIVVRGPHVMAGYWRRPELTAQRFPRRDGLFPELHTGDYGRLDEDGYLYFHGRRDDLYKERGFRVSATEVEAAALRVPEVESAAVLPPAGDRPATLVAVTTLAPDQLAAALRDQIEEFKIPRRCLVVSALPLSGNGKVDKRALSARLPEPADA